MSKNEYIAGVLNFFLLGPGYIYNGKRRILGIFLTLGAILATYVEFQLQGLLDESNGNSTLYKILFAGFFLLAVGTAYDGFKEAKEINNN